MKFLIVLCAVSAVALGYHLPAPLNKDGTVADTEEVSLAKQEHFAKLAEAGGATHLPARHSSYIYSAQPEDKHYHEDNHRYDGPPAPLNHDGTVAETPEVKHVKQERLAALAEAFAKAPQHYEHDDRHNKWKRSVHQFVPSHSTHYHGPPAPLNHDGTVAETDEVKEAKAVHFAAHAKVQQGNSYNHHIYTTSQGSNNHISHLHEDIKYHGPPAPLNHDGTVAETPEVSHVKQERLAALAEAFAKAPQHYDHEDHHNKWKRSVQQFVPSFSGHYHGPPAPLNHDGTVAETEEVKEAKAVHFAAHAKVQHGTPYDHQSYYTAPVSHDVVHHHEESHRYQGPPAPLNHDGTVAETPEVQHVKHERLAALAEAFANAPTDEETHKLWKRSAYFLPSNSDHYHGPPAPLNHDGTVAETEEVKKAKAIHFAAFANVNYAPSHVQTSHHDQ